MDDTVSGSNGGATGFFWRDGVHAKLAGVGVVQILQND